MADHSDPAHAFQEIPGDEAADNNVIERVQELTWALLDEHITDDEMALLDNLLLSYDKARGTYIHCVQLHSELIGHFAVQPSQVGTAAAAKSPVLGFLSAGMPPIGMESPASEELK